jgi:CrcB protein
MKPTFLLYVAIGGAAGSVTRYAMTVGIHQRLATTFPVGTFVINVTGSLILGFISQLGMSSVAMSDETRLLLKVCFCGGYTTFSTFAYESARLMQEGDYSRAAAYVGLSVAGAIVGMFAGFALARMLISARSGA